MEDILRGYNDIRYLHENIHDIPIEYRKCSLHIALEKSDIKKDWENFKKLYKVSPEFLLSHLKTTGQIFDYNYKNLNDNEQYDLFH